MKNALTVLAVVSSAALASLLAGCSSPPASEPETVEASEQDLTAGGSRQAVRELLFAADGIEPWYRCTTGSGADRITFDILMKGNEEIRARARYSAQDWNRYDLETSVDLGVAKLAQSHEGTELHYAFTFFMNRKATRLDVGRITDGKGRLTVGDVNIPVRCNSHDAPWSPAISP
jgi:hypothetical protein